MASEKFCLKWEDFSGNVSNSFFKLRQKNSLYDVTLVSNDHQQVSAHKLVLSACSEVFSNIFNSNSSSNMMLYLDCVDVKEIKFMLDYIYQGEVQIHQEYLDRFLEIATKFKLSGLLSDGKEEEEVNETHCETEENEILYFKSDDEVSKNEKKIYKERSVRPISRHFDVNISSVAELDQKFEELIEKEVGGPFKCTVCEKKINNKKDMKRHLETHLSGLSYECSKCGRSFRSSNSLRKHDKRC